jgi:iron complex transport system substrate-binding protein
MAALPDPDPASPRPHRRATWLGRAYPIGRARRLGRASHVLDAPLPLVVVLLLIGCTAGTGGSPSAIATSPLATATPLPTPTPVTFPLALIDDEGTNVTIPSEPKHIVSLTPAATEILFAVGAGPRVVARVEDLANYPPESASLPIVATFKGVDTEKIVAAQADLVVSGGAPFGQGPAVEQLRRANIPVLVLAPTTTSGVLTDIRLVGNAAGEGASASALADSMAAQFDAIRAATGSSTHPKVFYEIDASSAIFTAAKGSFLDELLQIAGADPVTTGSATKYEVSLETLVTADPSLILLGDGAYGVTADQVKARAGWSTISAVKSGSIVAVDDVVITRPGPRLVLGLIQLLGAIHPELALPSGVPTPMPTTVPSPPAAGTP